MSDLISRQAAIDTIGNVPDHDDGMVWEALSHAQRDVALLPSVEPERKVGKWIEHPCAEEENGLLISNWGCNLCGMWERKTSDFCPNCGAKMEVDTNGTE